MANEVRVVPATSVGGLEQGRMRAILEAANERTLRDLGVTQGVRPEDEPVVAPAGSVEQRVGAERVKKMARNGTVSADVYRRWRSVVGRMGARDEREAQALRELETYLREKARLAGDALSHGPGVTP